MATKPYFILVKLTSRSRPERFFKALNSIIDNLSDKENYHIQCSFDENDATMNKESVIKRLNGYNNLTYYFGISTGKINAINRDIDKFPDFDILINFSDDQIFTMYGFDVFIREAMQKNFPDTDGFLHFHDGVQNRLATMTIMGKKYFQRTNYIYNPEFISDWADNFEQEVAKRLGKYVYMGDSMQIMMHDHPLHGRGMHLMDELYERNGKFYNADKETYFKHLANNFGL